MNNLHLFATLMAMFSPNTELATLNIKVSGFALTLQEKKYQKYRNWGAFTFPGLWGLFNGIYWPIIVRIVTTIVFRFIATDITAYFGYF